MKKKLSIVSKASISALLLASIVAPNVASAAQFDIWNGSTKVGNLNDMLLQDDKTAQLDVVNNGDKYRIELPGGQTYLYNNADAIAGANSSLPSTELYEKIAADLKSEAQTSPEGQGTLAVSSVTAINARQLQVTFSARVDPTTVLENGKLKSNIVNVDGTDLNSADYTGEFDSTNKILTIKNKTTDPWVKDKEYTVTIDKVKNAEATAVPKYATVVKMTDAVAPTIVSATAVTNQDKTRAVKVKFSEPVNFTAVKINNKVAVPAVTTANYADEWTLTATEDLQAGKAYTIEFGGLTDLLGNAATTSTTTVTVEKDTTKPTATLSAVGEKTFNIVFDKEMTTTVGITAVKVTQMVAGTETPVALAERPAFGTDKKTLKVQLATVPFTGTETSKELTVTVSGLKDSLQNEMASYTGKVTVTKDTTKPTIVSVVQTPGEYKKLDVTFSEEVKGMGTSNGDVFTVVDADNKQVSVGSTPVTVTTVVNSTETNGKHVARVTLSAALPKSGTYKLVAKQDTISDTASTVNKNAAQVVTFNYTAETPVPAQALTATLEATTDAQGSTPTDSSSSNRIVTVKFDQADVVNGLDVATGTYKVGAADNALNYTVDGNPLPEGTVVTFKNNDSDNSNKDTVLLNFSAVAEDKLPTALKNGGELSVSVANVKTEAGATVAYTAKNLTVADKTAPKMVSAFLTPSTVDAGNNYTLVIKFSEKIQAIATQTIAPAKFQIAGLKTGGELATAVAGTGDAVIDSSDATILKIEVLKSGFGATGDLIDLTKGNLIVKTLSDHKVTDQATTPNALANDETIDVTSWVK